MEVCPNGKRTATSELTDLENAIARARIPVGDEWLPAWAADDDVLGQQVLFDARRVKGHRVYRSGWAAGAAHVAELCGLDVDLIRILTAIEEGVPDGG